MATIDLVKKNNKAEKEKNSTEVATSSNSADLSSSSFPDAAVERNQETNATFQKLFSGTPGADTFIPQEVNTAELQELMYAKIREKRAAANEVAASATETAEERLNQLFDGEPSEETFIPQSVSTEDLRKLMYRKSSKKDSE